MVDSLTTHEEAIAVAQGWQLSPVFDTRGYVSHAVLPTQDSPHRDASVAFSFVWARAKQGDAVCRRALSIITAAELANTDKK